MDLVKEKLGKVRLKFMQEGTVRVTVWYTPDGSWGDTREQGFYPSLEAALSWLNERFSNWRVS